MAGLLPIVKFVLPHVASIVAAAVPALTRKKSAGADPVVTKQIGELQEAVRTNAESLKSLEQAVIENDKAIAEAIYRARLVATVSAIVAISSLCFAIVAWFK